MNPRTNGTILSRAGIALLLAGLPLSGQTVEELLSYAPTAGGPDMVWLQEEGDPPPHPEMMERGGPGGPWMQHDSKQANMLRMWKLTEYLELTEKQAEKFFPRWRTHRQEMQEVMKERRQLHAKFEKRIKAGKVSRRDSKKFVDELNRLDRARIELRGKHVGAVEDVLTEVQLAKYVTFEQHFMGQLRQRLGDRDMRRKMKNKMFKGRRDYRPAPPRNFRFVP